MLIFPIELDPALVGLGAVDRVVGAHEARSHAAAVAHESRALLVIAQFIDNKVH